MINQSKVFVFIFTIIVILSCSKGANIYARVEAEDGSPIAPTSITCNGIKGRILENNIIGFNAPPAVRSKFSIEYDGRTYDRIYPYEQDTVSIVLYPVRIVHLCIYTSPEEGKKPIPNMNVFFDSELVGVTDNFGCLNYTIETPSEEYFELLIKNETSKIVRNIYFKFNQPVMDLELALSPSDIEGELIAEIGQVEPGSDFVDPDMLVLDTPASPESVVPEVMLNESQPENTFDQEYSKLQSLINRGRFTVALNNINVLAQNFPDKKAILEQKKQELMPAYANNLERQFLDAYSSAKYNKATQVIQETKTYFPDSPNIPKWQVQVEEIKKFDNLIKSISQNIDSGNFSAAESNIKELAKLDKSTADSLDAVLKKAKKASTTSKTESYAGLENDINTALQNNDFTLAISKINELKSKDPNKTRNFENALKQQLINSITDHINQNHLDAANSEINLLKNFDSNSADKFQQMITPNNQMDEETTTVALQQPETPTTKELSKQLDKIQKLINDGLIKNAEKELDNLEIQYPNNKDIENLRTKLIKAQNKGAQQEIYSYIKTMKNRINAEDDLQKKLIIVNSAIDSLKNLPGKITDNEIKTSLNDFEKRANVIQQDIEEEKKYPPPDPNDPEGTYNSGRAFYDKRRFSSAVKWFKAIPKPSSEAWLNAKWYVQSQFLLGKMAEQQADYRNAIKYYKESIAFKSDYAPAHFGLASCFQLTGELKTALNHCREAKRYKLNFPPDERDAIEKKLFRMEAELYTALFKNARTNQDEENYRAQALQLWEIYMDKYPEETSFVQPQLDALKVKP